MAFFFGISQGVLSYISTFFFYRYPIIGYRFLFNIGCLQEQQYFCGILVTALGGYGNAIYIFSLVFVIGLIVILFTKNIEKQVS